jgi:hypothetical protein
MIKDRQTHVEIGKNKKRETAAMQSPVFGFRHSGLLSNASQNQNIARSRCGGSPVMTPIIYDHGSAEQVMVVA